MIKRQQVIIIGIDPGTRVTGYGIIKFENGRLSIVDYGCIRPPASERLSDRYLAIYNSVGELLDKYEPEALVVEMQYVHKNVQSAIKLGMARGTVVIAARQRGVEVFEYYPTQAKLAVVGNGKASKIQVQAMTQRLLNLSSLPEPEDAADALSLAICHAHAIQNQKILGKFL